jgi:Sensors of blue-light using FAD
VDRPSQAALSGAPAARKLPSATGKVDVDIFRLITSAHRKSGRRTTTDRLSSELRISLLVQVNLTAGCDRARVSRFSPAKSSVMQLRRLVYYSKYNMKPRGEAVIADLKQILASAIRTNSERGITGGLVFNRTYFCQVLEGEHALVLQTFARINRDPRHQDVVMVELVPIGERLFGAWSMGYAGNSALFEKLCAEHGHAGGFDPKNMSGSDLTAFILALVTSEENVASSQKIDAA